MVELREHKAPEPIKQPEILRVMIGYDERQPLAYNVLQHSIVRHSSAPVSITPLILSQLPLKRRGLTAFTFSRFLVPWLCGFKGKALFLDADMVVTGDIAEMFADSADMSAVRVMQAQDRFEWASAMLFNCGSCLRLTPEYVADERNKMFDLEWAPSVGKLPGAWNHCVARMEPKEANLYHFTEGIPCWHETAGFPEDQHWHAEKEAMEHTVSWMELMRGSVHAKPVLARMLKRYGIS